MKHSRNVLVALALSATVSAQVAQTWSLTIDQSALGDQPTTAIVDPSGATTVVGSVVTFYDQFSNTIYSDASIARVSPQGALLWHRALNLPSTTTTTFTDVAAGPAGSFYASGFTRPSPTNWDLVLARYGSDGTPLWSIRYDTGRSETAASIATDPNGDVWVVGLSGTYSPATEEVLLLRVSSAGSIVFARTWGGTTTGWDRGAAIVSDGLGGAYVTGRTNYTGSSSAVLLLRVDAAGNEVWSRALTAQTFEGIEDTRGFDLALDAAGAIYVTGRFYLQDMHVRPLLVKYDASGNLLWQRTVSDASHVMGHGQRVAVDPRGDVVLTGAWRGVPPEDIFVRKYDPAGNVVWTRNWAGPGGVDYPASLALDAAGEIVIAGASAPVGQPNLTDALALRLDRDGRVLWARTLGLTSYVDSGVGAGFGPLGTVLFAASIFETNSDGLVVRFDESSVPFCFGDGSGTACPCGNATPASERAGCASSLGQGGRLSGEGAASLAADTLLLRSSGMPNASALYFQGTTQVGAGAGATFGDGLRCAGGTIVRLKTTTNVGGGSQYPAAGDPSVSQAGQIGAPGTRAYQVWYRNVAGFCTNDTFNLTNGVLVTWTS